MEKSKRWVTEKVLEMIPEDHSRRNKINNIQRKNKMELVIRSESQHFLRKKQKDNEQNQKKQKKYVNKIKINQVEYNLILNK